MRPLDPFALRAAREANQLLLKDVETALRSRAKWRLAARALEDQVQVLQGAEARVIEEFKKTRSRDLDALANAHEVVLTLGSDLETKTADHAAVDRALAAVTSELDRLLAAGNGRPPSWVLGEVKRIRALAGKDEEPVTAPGGAT